MSKLWEKLDLAGTYAEARHERNISLRNDAEWLMVLTSNVNTDETLQHQAIQQPLH